MIGDSLPTSLFALVGAHLSCPLLELTQRDAEQVQALLLGDRFPEGLDLGHAVPGSRLGLHDVVLQSERLLSAVQQHN